MNSNRRLSSLAASVLLCLSAAALVISCGHPADRTGPAAAQSTAVDNINGSGVKNPLDAELFRAIAANDGAAVQSLLEQGADVNATDILGRTPLFTAAFYHRPEMAKLLLAKGARTDARDATGLAPLHAAVIAGAIPVTAALIDAGADINAKTETGKTPLHLAAATGELDMARLLLLDGADKTLTDNHGETAAALGEMNHHTQTAALIRKSAKPAAAVRGRTTPAPAAGG
jgi:ankyrin repeat protein